MTQNLKIIMQFWALVEAFAILPAVSAVLSGFDPAHLPYQSDPKVGQFGYNQCGKTAKATSKCQNVFVKSATDFCFFAPPTQKTVGEAERIAVAYCSQDGYGTRLIPPGTFKNLHFVRAKHYVQLTATGNFTKVNIPKGDEGGELGTKKLASHPIPNVTGLTERLIRARASLFHLRNLLHYHPIDPSGPDGHGNPLGAVVFGEGFQFDHWTEFISDNEFCLRACYNGPKAETFCQHIYDVMGCQWNIPGNYEGPGFDECDGDDVPLPMGQYRLPNGKIGTWQQGDKSAAPAPGEPGKVYNCRRVPPPGRASYTNQGKVQESELL